VGIFRPRRWQADIRQFRRYAQARHRKRIRVENMALDAPSGPWTGTHRTNRRANRPRRRRFRIYESRARRRARFPQVGDQDHARPQRAATAPYLPALQTAPAWRPLTCRRTATSASVSSRPQCRRRNRGRRKRSSSKPPSSSSPSPPARSLLDPTHQALYHVHELFPNLQGKDMPAVGWKLGLAPGLGVNYHNSAIQVLPNGDLLAAYYNAPSARTIPTRHPDHAPTRRHGDWDMPEPFPVFADAALAGPSSGTTPRIQAKYGCSGDFHG